MFRAGGYAKDTARHRWRRNVVGVEAPVHDRVIGFERERAVALGGNLHHIGETCWHGGLGGPVGSPGDDGAV